MKLKMTRPDGTVIEADGTVEELRQLIPVEATKIIEYVPYVVPQYPMYPQTPVYPTYPIWGGATLDVGYSGTHYQ